MGKNQREKQIYMSGFTLGAGFGLLVLTGYILLGEQSDGLTFAGLLMGIMLIAISFVWRRRANKS